MTQVWIIDDDPSIRWVLEKALTQADILVRSFADADSALRALGREQPGPLSPICVCPAWTDWRFCAKFSRAGQNCR